MKGWVSAMSGYSEIGYGFRPGMLNAMECVDHLVGGLHAGFVNACRPIEMPAFYPQGIPVRDYNYLVHAYNQLQSTTSANAKKLAAAWRVEKQRADKLAAELNALKKRA